MLLPGIHVRPSPIHGRGLFASRPVPAGCVVWHPCPGCPRWDAGQTGRLGPGELDWLDEFGYRLATGGILLPCGQAYLMNHSCEAAVLSWGLDFGVAVRDILPGQEVTYDYRAFVDDTPFRVRCSCGTAACVGEVLPGAGTDPDLQRRWSSCLADALRRIPRIDQPLEGDLLAISPTFRRLRRGEGAGAGDGPVSIQRPGFLSQPVINPSASRGTGP
jgi:uncharacterized protein